MVCTGLAVVTLKGFSTHLWIIGQYFKTQRWIHMFFHALVDYCMVYSLGNGGVST